MTTALPTTSPITRITDEALSSVAILIFISLLLITLFTSFYLKTKKVNIIHETVVSTVLGLIVGLVIRLFTGYGFNKMVTFDNRYFFNLLLPPIILHSGYDMKKKNFFRYIGVILSFAIFGTLISTCIIGIFVYLFSVTGIHHLNMTFLDCMVFGAILSSTDPVTVLAIFQQLRVDPKLYSIIFGESILNDSVAIVLFSTLGRFRGKSVSFSNISLGALSFMAVFIGSILIGIIISLITTLCLKHSKLHLFPSLESCIIILLAYSSYLLSNAIHMSGIVSLLFCGITLKHYARDNMSTISRKTTKNMFRVLSQLSENFIFIYLGIALFTKSDDSFYPGLIIFTLFIILFARYSSVISVSNIINYVTRSPNSPPTLPNNYQLMIIHSGLRGAISFALSNDFTGESGDAVRTTTLLICVISIIGLGGTTNMTLKKLGIKTDEITRRVSRESHSFEYSQNGDQDEDEDDDSKSSDEENVFPVDNFIRPSFSQRNQVLSNHTPDNSHWFVNFDSTYLKPIFSRNESRFSSSVSSPSRNRILSSPSLHTVTIRAMKDAN